MYESCRLVQELQALAELGHALLDFDLVEFEILIRAVPVVAVTICAPRGR